MIHVFDSDCRVRDIVREVSHNRTTDHVYDHFCPFFDHCQFFIERFHAAYIDRCCTVRSNLQHLHVGDLFHCVPSGHVGHYARHSQIDEFSSIHSRMVFLLGGMLT